MKAAPDLLAEAASVETEGDNPESKKDRAVHGMQNVVGEKAAIFLQGYLENEPLW